MPIARDSMTFQQLQLLWTNGSVARTVCALLTCYDFAPDFRIRYDAHSRSAGSSLAPAPNVVIAVTVYRVKFNFVPESITKPNSIVFRSDLDYWTMYW